MTFGAEIWGPALISAAGSIGGGYLSGRSNTPKETKIQRQQRKLIDDLIMSLKGGGSFNDLFNSDEDTFQKSFVDPAKSIFKNQIAPSIRQQYIGSGQQNGTGLEDQLLRAGVDLDQLLNQHLASFQESALNRKSNTISNILGQQGGVQPSMSNSGILGNAVGGYLQSSGFSDAITNIFGPKGNQSNPEKPKSKGFTTDAAYAAQAPYGGR